MRRVHDDLLSRLSPYTDETFSLNELPLDRLPQECPVYGTADYREGMLGVRHADGTAALDLQMEGCRTYAGRPELPGLPCAGGEGAETLELTLKDALSGLRVLLNYTLYADCGILARSARIQNDGTAVETITRALSCCVDFEGSGFRFLTLSGSWARERDITLRPLAPGQQGTASLRGSSSHQGSPFMAFLSPDASETQGEVYGMALCYSGNYLASADVDQDGNTRAMLGIHPEGFSWRLSPGESFCTPEAYLCYSAEGLDGMSQRFHRFGNGIRRGRGTGSIRQGAGGGGDIGLGDFVLQLQGDALGGFLPDAGGPGQGVHIPQEDGQVQIPQGHGPQETQGRLGPHPADGSQLQEELLFLPKV